MVAYKHSFCFGISHHAFHGVYKATFFLGRCLGYYLVCADILYHAGLDEAFYGKAEKQKSKRKHGDRRDFDFGGKNVIIRADLNVPIKDGKISDDTRIRASIKTIKYVMDKGGRVI